MGLDRLLGWSFHGNGARAWLIAVATLVVGLMLLLIARRMLIARATRIAAKTQTDVDDFFVKVLRRTHPLFLFLVALVAGSMMLTLAPLEHARMQTLLVAGLILQLAVWGNDLIAYLVTRYSRQSGGAGKSTITAMSFLGRLVLWTVLALLLLDNFGVQVTTLIATLGVGGIAVALAAQSVLGDLLAAISIYLDRPFVIGDFIIFDGLLGSVDYVGLRSTRINSLSGEQIVLSNSDLLKSRIHNYRLMRERRVVFTIRVAYGTPYELVSEIPALLRQAVEAQSPVRFDRAHFAAYDESALVFEIVYYVLTPDYTPYMDIQQAINFFIMQRFEEKGIAFAHPVRMLTLNGGQAQGLAALGQKAGRG